MPIQEMLSRGKKSLLLSQGSETWLGSLQVRCTWIPCGMSIASAAVAPPIKNIESGLHELFGDRCQRLAKSTLI